MDVSTARTQRCLYCCVAMSLMSHFSGSCRCFLGNTAKPQVSPPATGLRFSPSKILCRIQLLQHPSFLLPQKNFIPPKKVKIEANNIFTAPQIYPCTIHSLLLHPAIFFLLHYCIQLYLIVCVFKAHLSHGHHLKVTKCLF